MRSSLSRRGSVMPLAAFLFLFVLSAAVAQQDPSGPDVRILKDVNASRSEAKTFIFGAVDNSVWPIVVAAPPALVLYGWIQDDASIFDSGVLLGGSEVISYGVRHLFKVGVKRKRPYEELAGLTVGHLDSADPYSFPSGHTTGAFVLATMLALRHPRPVVYVPAFFWASMVGYGRMYFGLHYPTDVLGGAVIGAGCSLIVFHFQERILPLIHKLLGEEKYQNLSFAVYPSEEGTTLQISFRF